MEICRDEIIVKGKPTIFESMKIDNKVIVFTGKFIRKARVRQEWFTDVEQPDLIIAALRKVKLRPDLFTFIQRLPDTTPKYNYYMEQEKITALPIKNYKHWWEKQIAKQTRKKARRAAKRGVEFRVAAFDDELVRGITAIFNESPFRQGKPFWHYGKDFDTVKKEMSLDLDRSEFIGAYQNGELIGIVKLLYAEKIAEPTIIVSKTKYQKKYVSNALIANSVEMCAMRGIPYLKYGPWWRGSMADFLRRHGFERMQVPRYYVPLTTKGKMIIGFRLHRGIKQMLPESLIIRLINLRTKWYLRRYPELADA